jgi:hypothetical protein
MQGGQRRAALQALLRMTSRELKERRRKTERRDPLKWYLSYPIRGYSGLVVEFNRFSKVNHKPLT